MSVSTLRGIGLLLLLISLCTADLPSCARAKCVHCTVDFIARMCPTACGGCSGQTAVMTQRPQQPPPVYNNQPAQFSQSVNSRQISNEGGILNQQRVQVPQQPQVNIPFQPHAQPVQFAAPVYQGQQIPYPPVQQQPPSVPTVTLAPLVETPKIATFDPNLSRQPADLAQPLPEYQTSSVTQFGQNNFQLPQPQQPQQPLGYGTQVDNIFNQPNPFQLPGQQQPALFGAQQPQQQSALLNPFQPFLQQSNNAFDPFNLFGNLNQNQLNQQGISTVQAQQYGQVQHQGNYNQQAQQFPQQQFNQQPYQQQQQQQSQPQPQYTQQYQQQQQQYNQQYNQQQQQQQQYYQNQQPQQQQQQFNQNQQPQQLPTAPAQQQTSQQVPQQPLPQTRPVAAAAASASVDQKPVRFEKYVDPGKGTPLGAPQGQCPRPGWQPCITKDTANDRFRNCCSRLGEGCAPLCNYDATLATMQLAVLTGRCPLSKVADVMICASGYQDASRCCEAYGVFEPGYEHCRPYCNPSAGLPEGGLLTEKYKCLVKLQNIQQCFYVSQKP